MSEILALKWTDFTASYSGDSNFASSTSTSFTLTVTTALAPIATSTSLDEQFKTTEQGYLGNVRAIGALLRLRPDEDQPASAIHGRLPFDSAEDAWLKYRDASCASMATQWEGSQSGVAYADCRLKLIWNHMNELGDFYADLWH